MMKNKSIAVGRIEILHMINEQNGKNIKSSYGINDNEMIKQILVLAMALALALALILTLALPLSFNNNSNNNNNNNHNDKHQSTIENCKICTLCYGFDEE